MIEKDKVLVFDIDGTICSEKKPEQSYECLEPNEKVVKLLREYKEKGFYIILDSSRNMNTFEGNIGKINVVTLKTLINWLDKQKIPYDEIHVGKPWCGKEGFCIDDKTIRPSEFITMSYNEIRDLLNQEKTKFKDSLQKDSNC